MAAAAAGRAAPGGAPPGPAAALGEAVAADWSAAAREAFVGIREWRVQHPQATWTELEAALNARLSRLRARLLQDLALASVAARVEALLVAARPPCPACGGPLTARGQQTRPVAGAVPTTRLAALPAASAAPPARVVRRCGAPSPSARPRSGE